MSLRFRIFHEKPQGYVPLSPVYAEYIRLGFQLNCLTLIPYSSDDNVCCFVASIVHTYSTAGLPIKLFTQLLLPVQLIKHSRAFQTMLQKACSLLFKAGK
jgi:hypothetical protein